MTKGSRYQNYMIRIINKHDKDSMSITKSLDVKIKG